MQMDTWGLAVSATNGDAIKHLNATFDGYLGFRADVGERLKKTLAADPGCALALCLRGYFMLLMMVRGLVPRAREALAAAHAVPGLTDREQSHVKALAAWCDGDIGEALRQWEAILTAHPLDILALKLAHFWHFYLGDARGMLNSVSKALAGWDERVPGYGYVLGLQAFGLEETGDYATAERTGRRAIELNPADIWATHAVAHVMEMQDRPQDGVRWIESRTADFAGCNNFRFHVWWHRCLFHLALGDHDRVLELYDREVRAESTSEYLDICNAVSLLWRLEDAGVATGRRWDEVAAQAATRIDDHLLAFVDAHYTMALAAAGPAPALDAMLMSVRTCAARGDTTEARVMAEVGATICDAAAAHRRRDWARVIELLLPARTAIVRIGGSHAQRDMFEQMLISACLAGGHQTTARELLAERLRHRPNNQWAKARLAV